MTAPLRILVHEPFVHGHNSAWLWHIARAIAQAGHHPVVAAHLEEAPIAHWRDTPHPESITWVALPKRPTRRHRHHVFASANELSLKHDCQEIFFPLFDHIAAHLPQKLAPKNLPRVPVGGIWFLPPLTAEGWQIPELPAARHPAWMFWKNRKADRKNLRTATRARAIPKGMAWLAANGRLSRLAFLDPRQADAFTAQVTGTPSLLLPDFWTARPQVGKAEARRALGLPADRFMFLHIGISDTRKGLTDACEAMLKLDAEHQTRALLVRAGGVKDEAAALCAKLEAKGLLALENRFVAEERMALYYAAADAVLLPYRHHAGSSGILSHAAAAGKPVIAAQYGLIGRLVEQNRLGLCHAHLDVDDLARAMAQMMDRDPAADTPALADYAARISPEAFMDTLAKAFAPA